MKKQLTVICCVALAISLLSGCAATEVVTSPPTESLSAAETPDQSASFAPTESPEADPDSRGISGMDGGTLLLLLDMSYDIPMEKKESSDLDYSAYTCVSSATIDGITYDYSISLDKDDEIIAGTFGVSSFSASDTDLFLAADLYFYALAITEYNGSDNEQLSSWFEDSLKDVTDQGTSITIGDATFELYGINGMYWVDVSKAT